MSLLHDMTVLVGRHAPLAFGPSAVPRLQLYRSDVTPEPLQAAYRPMLCVVVSGTKRTLLGSESFTYAVGDCVVVSAELPVSGMVTEGPYLALGLELDPSTIARTLIETGVKSANDTPPTRGLVVTQMNDDLLDPLGRLLRLLDRPGDIPVLAPMIEREILWRLLSSQLGPTLRQIGSTGSRLSGISRAIRWIRTHYAQGVRMDDLAELAGMSLSTFHRHFRTVTTMSPLQFHKQVRLQEARTRLLSGLHGAADTGFSVGYDSPSQFSRDYSRLFGAPPGRDASRMRGALEPDAGGLTDGSGARANPSNRVILEAPSNLMLAPKAVGGREIQPT